MNAHCVYEECGRKFAYDPGNLKASHYPFCSARCKGADLGSWVNEDYRVPSLPDIRGIRDDEEGPEDFDPGAAEESDS